MQSFTFEPIPGRILKNRLPEGVALVLEGGGLRGYYSSGVMEAFMERDILFPYIIGVSAGAANSLSYASGQALRSRQIIEHYVADKEYVSKRNLIKYRSIFNFDHIFGTIPEKHVFYDWEMLYTQNTRVLTGAMNCADGKTVWFEKEALCAPFTVTRASCSMPFLAKTVEYDGLELLDGGVTDPIPIEKSIADGNRFHVIVLTRNAGYKKTPFGHEKLLRAVCRKHPALAEAMLKRHETYNRQLELCEKLEKEGRAIIIRPREPIRVGRTGADIETLLELHDEGVREGREAVDELLGVMRNY